MWSHEGPKSLSVGLWVEATIGKLLGIVDLDRL